MTNDDENDSAGAAEIAESSSNPAHPSNGVRAGERRGGRQAGTPNKSTADVKALAQTFTDEAIELLAAIMRDTNKGDRARVAAAKELLDRGHGRPAQSVIVADKRVSHEEMLVLLD